MNASVLRFRREYELVWLNDKNALVVFNDFGQATVAMKRLDHKSLYFRADVVLQNGASVVSTTTTAWGGTSISKKVH